MDWVGVGIKKILKIFNCFIEQDKANPTPISHSQFIIQVPVSYSASQYFFKNQTKKTIILQSSNHANQNQLKNNAINNRPLSSRNVIYTSQFHSHDIYHS